MLTHPALAHVAYILETPGMDEGYDAINLARARRSPRASRSTTCHPRRSPPRSARAAAPRPTRTGNDPGHALAATPGGRADLGPTADARRT